MAVLTIPTTTGEPYYRQKTKLEGRDFILEFSFNQRAERWSLTIYDEEETALVRGIRLVTNWPLLRHYRYDKRLPPGELWAMALDGSDEPPGLDELGPGKRVELTYVEAGT